MFWDTLAQFVSTISEVSKGNAQAKAYQSNANLLSQNASATVEKGRIAEEQIRREGRKRAGQIRANVGASGFDLSGSSADILAESVYNAEYDALATRYSYETEAKSLQTQSRYASASASDAKRAGYMNAASSLILNKSTFATTETAPFRLGGV